MVPCGGGSVPDTQAVCQTVGRQLCAGAVCGRENLSQSAGAPHIVYKRQAHGGGLSLTPAVNMDSTTSMDNHPLDMQLIDFYWFDNVSTVLRKHCMDMKQALYEARHSIRYNPVPQTRPWGSDKIEDKPTPPGSCMRT